MKYLKLLSIALLWAFSFGTSKAQTVTVTAPNGGEILYACQTYTITWSQTGSPSNYWNIDYSSNGGTTWTSIASNFLITNGQFVWTVPNLQSNTVLVRVTDFQNASTTDASNSFFTINIPVTVTSPNGGETWQGLSSQTITWNAQGTSGSYNIAYSTNGGSTWTNIVTNYTTGTGTYNWTVPNIPSTNCMVRVMDYVTNCMVDISNSVFTITAATPILTAPNGGETIYINCVYPITWNTSTFFSTVRLEYSTNNGVSWFTIISSTTNNGTYNWTVPNSQSTNCLVRASNTGDLSVFDVSNAVFTIAPSVTVTSPNGGESIVGCTTFPITWTKTTCVGNWNIAYSLNNGTTWTNIATNVANTGVNNQTYNWYVPNNLNSTQALIRVESFSSPGTYNDVSNAVFTISSNNNIVVTSPNGGESWIGCSTYNITWTKLASPCNTSYTLAYSLNNGTTWTNIATSVTDNGLASQSYSWLVPNTLSSTQALIRVTSNDWANISDVSNAVFSLTPSNDITVTAPNGGETLTGLGSYTITWTNLPAASGLYNVQYSTNNGTTWTTLATNISGNSYNWATIPNTPSTTCLVKVIDNLNTCKFDVSNANFTIVAATPILTAPNGGQSFNIGCTTNITWNTATFYSTVNLYYSSNGGSTWNSIVTGATNNGTYTWTIPNATSTNCLIKAANSADVNIFDVSDAVFTILPAVTVTAANGGENWIGCTTYNITWTKTTCIGNWSIYYSTNNGSTWTAIATNVVNTGAASQSYAWQVPNGITTAQALIKVESFTSPGTYFDQSDAVFTITPSNDITVTAPNGGETIAALSTYSITWTNTVGASGQYNVQYSLNNGTTWTTVATNITGNSYSWSVPNTSSSTCLVKVIDAVNTCKFDVSNATFTITPSGPVLLTPNGGETVYINCVYQITWAQATFFSTVRLEYSTNNGATWNTIIASTTNNGTYNWTVPNTQSTNCLVRASNTANLTIYDESDAVFTIAPSVTVTSPNGGETIVGCSTFPITWTKTTCVGNWNIAYSLNNGSTWTNIATNIVNTGVNNQTYNWVVPNNLNSTQALIRVESFSSPGTYNDVSNAVFTLQQNNNITVTSPNGGETWVGCSTYNITWTKLNTCNASYTLAYSLNNGTTWTNIVTQTDNGLATQSYAWLVPNTLSSTQALIRVTSVTWTNISDQSDAVFTLVPSTDITVTAPNGGETLTGLGSYTITWTNLPAASGLYNVQYSTNNGTTWTTLATNISGNSYNWATIPNTPSTTCLVKVIDNLNTCKFDVSDANFTIAAATPILTAPNGGQSFNIGCTTNITWNTTTFYATVNLYYSTNNGTTWTTIATGLTNSGTYTWTVPNATSLNCLIKAANSADVNVFDVSDAVFTILPAVTVTAANGGENWIGCTTYNITWTKTTCIGNWSIYYSTNNGSTWTAIATNVVNTGAASQSYAWQVPNGITTAQALIKVESFTTPASYFDISDGNFTITPSTDITVTAPNGGETIAALSTYSITWTNTVGASGQYNVQYSTNNGTTWTTLATNITGNSYSWSVPNVSSTTCLVKVIDAVNTCKFDVSNATFTITPPTPILLTPNGGETVYINCVYAITWNSSTFFSTVKLDYSTNNGATWLPIIASTANSGTYNWTVPNTQSPNCLVRASNTADITIFDVSNAVFTIAPSVTVTSPNGGETIVGCSTFPITWTKTTCVGNWNIAYSLNNGSTWTNIATNIANTGVNNQTYNWVVPNNLNSTQALIRVESFSSPGTYNDVSNAVFTLQQSNNITLVTPNGGETWVGCQTYNITWTKSVAPCNASYTLAYSLNNGTTWTNIVTQTDNGLASQTYAWLVPSTISSTQALIRVTSVTWTNISDVSDAVFTINLNNDITVTSPNGGETLTGLGTYTITWTNSIYASGLYNVQYSTNNGGTWTNIVTNYSGNSYLWSVPNTPSTACLIRVTDNLAPCRLDVSNANFTIAPATPILLTPNGGEILNAGATYNITWNTSTFYSTINLYYSINNGTTWTTITTNIANSGTYSWTIPNVNSNQCLVKAANFADVTVFDVSNAVFTINPAVRILTPNGGENLGGCTVTSITFDRSPTWNNYRIEYSVNNGATWILITASYTTSANPASYTWTVPNVASTQTLVKVTPTAATANFDVSDAIFTLTRPVVIIQPNFGGTMTVGSNYNITWQSDGISNLYDIFYSINGGASFINIVTAYNTVTNNYNWTVPNNPSTNCKIWVRDNTNSCKSDTSDVAFTISSTPPPITLLTPNGGQNLTGCFTYNITWNDSPSIGTYDLLYSTNSGATWTNIITNYVTATQNYNWIVPNGINSSNVLVRVRSTAAPTTFDQSDALLSINSGNLVALPSDTTICAGASFQITSTGGFNYNWSPAAGLSATNIPNPIATPSTNTSYIVQSINGSCILRDTVNVTIFAASVSITTSPSTTICAGTNVTFTANPVNGGTTPIYQWKVNGLNVGTNSPTYSSSSLANGDVVTVVLTSNAPCLVTTTVTSPPVAMTVISIPTQPVSITGSNSICAGSSNTYSIASVGGATSYTWTLPATWTGSSTTTSISSTAGTTGGNVTVTANNTCGNSTPQSLTVTVNVIPSTPGLITGNTTVCSGTSNTYSITPVSGATSYTWTLPGGWTGTSTTNSINATASTTSGNITVTANNTCGNSPAQTLAITVNTIPATPGVISGLTPICAGTSNTYSIAGVSGATSYTWTLPGGWSGTSTSTSINTTASATSGNITVTADNTCGSSSPRTFAVVVNSIPAQPGTITGSATVCQNSSNTYSIAAVSGATSYNWTLPSGWSGTSTTNSISTTASTTSGNISVTATNMCGTSTAQTLAVTVNPLPIVSASGTATICSGTSTPLTASGATTYSWLPSASLDNAFISNPNASPTTTTTYTVTGTTAGCSSTANVTITVTASPVVSISGTSTICIGNSTTLTASGATTYSWLPNTGLSNPAIANPVASPTSTTTYTVTGTTGICSSTATITVTVNTPPSVTAGGTATICAGASTPLSASGATTYSWLPTTGLSNPNIANPIATPTSTTTYTVTGSTGGCSSTATVTITTNSPTANAGSPATICSGSSTTLNASGGTTYSWLPTTGLSATNIANPIASPTTTTTYTVTVGNGTCSSTATVTITVNSLPAANAGPDVSIACGGSTTLAASGGTSYSWSPTTGLSNPNIANPIATPAFTTTYTVTVSNGTCSATDNVVVTVGNMTANAGPDVTICSGNSTALSGSSTGSGAPAWVNIATSYNYTQAVGTYTAITGGTVWLNGASPSMDDVVSGSITIPAFTFNNIVYTNIYISTNGFITFGATAPTTTNYTPISSTETYAGAVSPFGVDLNKSTTGTPEIRYQQVGNEFIIQWRDVGRYAAAGTLDRLSFQVRLNTSTNQINVVYATTSTLGASTTYPQVGLRGPNNAFATNVKNRSVISSTGAWVNSVAGTTNASNCYYNSATPATVPANGTTFTWSLPSATTTYAWSPSTGLSCTACQNTVATPTVTTTYTLTATSGACSAVDQVTVTVVSGSSVSAGPDATICAGNSTTLNGTGGGTYSWSPATGLSATNIANPVASPTSTTTYTLTVSNGSCSYTDNVIVTVNAIPSIPGAISGSTTICSGSTNTYSIAAVSGATSYTWTLPGGWTGTSTTNSISATANATSGNITVTANNSCGSSPAQSIAVNIATTPSQPGTISGAVVICSGSSNTYSVAAVGGATSYTWTLPGGWSGTSTTNSISTTANTTSGTITVTANNSCGGVSTPQTLAVTVNTVPSQPGAITGSTSGFCQGTTQTYGISAVSGATSYTWSAPSGWTGSSTTTSINLTVGTTSGTISVIANNACGSSIAQSITVTPDVLPAAPSVISGNNTICGGSSETYSISSVSGATSYVWSLPSTWTGSSTTNSIVAGTDANGGVVSVYATNLCGAGPTESLNVISQTSPSTPTLSSADVNVCDGSNANYAVINDANASSYTWTLPASWTGSSTSASITATANTNSGNVTVVANNSCGISSPLIISVIVNPLPNVTLSALGTVCDIAPAFTLTGGSPSGGIYSGVGVSSDSIFTPSIAGSGIHTITYTYSDGTCSNFATSTIQVDLCTGTITQVENFDIDVYPNPFSDYTVFYFGSSIEFINAQILVYDVLGKEVKNVSNISANKVVIDGNNLENGMYFYRIINNNKEIKSGKLIFGK